MGCVVRQEAERLNGGVHSPHLHATAEVEHVRAEEAVRRGRGRGLVTPLSVGGPRRPRAPRPPFPFGGPSARTPALVQAKRVVVACRDEGL